MKYGDMMLGKEYNGFTKIIFEEGKIYWSFQAHQEKKAIHKSCVSSSKKVQKQRASGEKHTYHGAEYRFLQSLWWLYEKWQHFGKKEVYYIISVGLGEDIIERSFGDLNGFAEHLEEYNIAGKIYVANVMDARLVKNQSIFKEAYDMGYSI